MVKLQICRDHVQAVIRGQPDYLRIDQTSWGTLWAHPIREIFDISNPGTIFWSDQSTHPYQHKILNSKKYQFLPSYSKTFRFLLSWESTEDTSTIPYPWDGITWYTLSHDWVTWHGHMTKISRDFVIRAHPTSSSTLGCKLSASLWNSLLIRIISTIWLDARLRFVSRDHVIKKHHVI